MNGYRPSRSCSKNHVNYSDNITNIPNRQEQILVKPSKKKGSKKKGKNSVSPRKQPIPCKNHAAGLGNAASNTADEEARGSNVFHGCNFIQSLDSSIFPHKKGHVNVEDNENDEDSSFLIQSYVPLKISKRMNLHLLNNSSP